MGAGSRRAAVTTDAHGSGTTGESTLNDQFRPLRDTVTVFFEETLPSVINGEKEFCRAGNIHAADYKAMIMAGKAMILHTSRSRHRRAMYFVSVSAAERQNSLQEGAMQKQTRQGHASHHHSGPFLHHTPCFHNKYPSVALSSASYG